MSSRQMFASRFVVCLAVWLLALHWQVVAVAFEQQTPFEGGFKYAPYDAGLVHTIEDIRGLSSSEYTTVSHPAYANYGIRIKQNGASFCDDGVR